MGSVVDAAAPSGATVGAITGLGTGVATALAVNVGSAGAPVTNGGALGTPSSGVITNLTGSANGAFAPAAYTPTVTLVGGAGNTVPVFSTNTGRYAQIGKMVFVDVWLTGDGGDEGGGTGVLTIALPVASSASAPAAGYFPCGEVNSSTNSVNCLGKIVAGESVISLAYQSLLTAVTAWTGADMDANRAVRLKFFYEAA